MNKKCLEDFKNQYKTEDPKTSVAGLKLAKFLMKVKDKFHINEAMIILNRLVLPEAKFIAMELSIKSKNYSDAYYYANFLSITKCNCKTVSSKYSEFFKPKLISDAKSDIKKGFSKALCEIEGHHTVWYKHKAEELKLLIVSAVGKTAAKSYQKEGSNLNYIPSITRQ